MSHKNGAAQDELAHAKLQGTFACLSRLQPLLIIQMCYEPSGMCYCE